MKSVEVQGYSKQKAFESANLDQDLEMFKNATQAWKKLGSPLSTKAMNSFMASYLKDKKAVGAYIVVEPASDDTRVRPYEVINEVTHGKRKTTTTYQIKEAELKVKSRVEKNEETGEETTVKVVDVLSTGTVAGRAAKKDQAMKLMKELIDNNKRDYVIEIVKEVTDGQKFAGYGLYTPSKSAKKGKFLFFVGE